MSEYAYGHTREWEASHFAKFTTIERQIQYGRAVLRKHPKYGVKKIQSTLAWKFGKCVLNIKTIKELRLKTDGR